MSQSSSKRCICGRSQTHPLCDGSHRSQGWSCARSDDGLLPYAFVASRSLGNLADRLAHRFDGASLGGPQDSARCRILVIITDGHDIEQLRRVGESVQAEQRRVMCVGVPPNVLAWAFPGASFLSLESDAPALLWKSAEEQLLAELVPAARQAPPRVFLSHSVRDEAQLFPIVETLRGHFRVPLFVCADSIPTGSGWHGEIREQLEQCDLFLFIASEAANRSVFCAFEAGMALALGKPIHVISLDGQPPPAHLQHLQAIDADRLQRRKPWLTRQDALLEASLLALNPGS